jgi:outer membrane immunogenic protein
MRKVLGLVGATLLFVGPAFAADLPVKAPRAAPLVPVFSWTGFYLGVHGGYGWSTTDGLDLKGGFGGGQIGYNYQVNNFVFGIEGDGAWADISQTFTGVAFGIPVSATITDNALASLRGRLGVTFGNALLYGTAGGGWGDIKISGTALGVTVSDSAWHSGWTAGGGIEWAFQPNWTAKLEYLHYGLGSATQFNIDTGKIDIDTIKVGINYLFH